MQALLVHGMGRTSLSWTPTLIRLRTAGIRPTTFGYSAASEKVSVINRRLIKSIVRLSQRGEYVLVGHSLGGVLLRAALQALPEGTTLPKFLFLVGSPITASRLAVRLKTNPVFRLATRDCGRMLGSTERMLAVAASPVPTVAIVGTRGMKGRFTAFGNEPNDSVVAVSEASADWFQEEVYVPVVHTLLPASKWVADVIVARVCGDGVA